MRLKIKLLSLAVFLGFLLSLTIPQNIIVTLKAKNKGISGSFRVATNAIIGSSIIPIIPTKQSFSINKPKKGFTPVIRYTGIKNAQDPVVDYFLETIYTPDFNKTKS